MADARSGWVYRTDGSRRSGPVVVEPARPAAPAVASPPPAPRFELATGSAEARTATREPGSDRPPVAQAPPHQRFERHTPPAASEGSGWFATGFYLMTLPITLGVSIMFAPVSWILGSRSRR